MSVGKACKAIVALLAAVVVAGGCEGSDSVDENRVLAKIAELRSMPSFEDTEQLVNAAVQRVAEAASVIVPALRWYEFANRNQGLCGGEFSGTGGLNAFVAHMGADGAVPDAQWPLVLQAARDIATQAGMTQLQVLADEPGNRNIRLYSDDGNAINIGYMKNTLVTGETGCRLPAADLAQQPS